MGYRSRDILGKPDGYTLYFGRGSGHDLIMPHLQKMPYDVHKDLAPVARLTINSVVICVSTKSPINSMKDLIDWAKKGNKVTAAVSTAAGSLDLVFKAFTKRTGIPIVTVPFSGGAEAVTALAGGHLQIGGGNPNEVIPHIKAGRFKAIGVALDYRDETLPNVPTLKEQGIDVTTWGAVRGVAVPAGTPPEIIEYLSATLKKVSEDEEYKKIMVSMNQPNYYQNTKDFTVFLQKAYNDYGEIIKELDIKM